MNRIISIVLAVFLGGSTITLAQERTGTSQADLPSYNAAFSIENTTGVTIPYLVRWGNESQWKHVFLQNGHTETHSFPLGENRGGRAPIPYVRFDSYAGDGPNVTPREYRLEFSAVGYAGYGSGANRTGPKRYFFQFAADGKNLNLKAH